MGKKRAVRVVEVTGEDLARFSFAGTKRLKLRLDGARRGFVFTMRASARQQMDDLRFRQVAQQLGDLVHPHCAVMVVLPDEMADLRAYALEAT